MENKKLSWFFESFENFETLRGMCLLFDKDSEYYRFSGFVTAALLDYDDPDKQISILGINTGHLSGWVTLKNDREEMRKMLSNCIEFVGENEEKSFKLEK